MDLFICYRVGKTGTYYEIGMNQQSYEKCEPEDLYMYIADKIKSCRTTTFIYFRGLDRFKMDIIKSIYLAGGKFVQGNPKTKDMESLDCKSLIGGDSAKVYHFTMVNHKKKIVFMDLENFFANHSEVMKTWGRHESFAYVKAYERAINELFSIGQVKRKRPVTISGMSRQLLKKKMPDFQPFNAKEVQIPEIGKTLDQFVRPSYNGGLCTYKAGIQGLHLGKGFSLDVNSMYPWIMITKPLPYHTPEYHQGEPTKTILEKAKKGEKALFIHLFASFELKENGIPCVRNSDITLGRGWLDDSYMRNLRNDRIVKKHKGKWMKTELTLTYMDYIDFLNNYKINSISYIDYVTMGMEKPGMFIPIVRPLYKIKRHSDGGRRRCVKMVLNSLSGIVSARESYENYAIVENDGEIHFEKNASPSDAKSSIYLGAYITSYARHELIHQIRMNYDAWIYSDTDCCFFIGEEIPKTMEIGEGIGKWSIEKEYDDIMIYKQKTYGYVKDGKCNFTLAGVKDEDLKNIEKIKDDVHVGCEHIFDDPTNKLYRSAEEYDNLLKIFEKRYGDTDYIGAYKALLEDMVEKREFDQQEFRRSKRLIYLRTELIKNKKEIDLLDAVRRYDIDMTKDIYKDFEIYETHFKRSLEDLKTYE